MNTFKDFLPFGKRNFLLKFLFLFIIVVSISLFSQDRSEIYKKFVSLYPGNKNVPSLAAGIIQNNKVIYVGASGMIDIENNVPASTKSVYRLASISKLITSVAIMQLVQNKKISLDEDVRKYLPYFPKKKWQFTVRQVLSHTSGLRTYKNNEEFNSTTNFPDIKSTIVYFSSDSLDFQPGTRYQYSTLSYNVLAAIIEEVSGLSFADYIKEKICLPSGMNNTYLDYVNNIIPNRAKGYQKNKFREIENAPLADLTIKFPGGGIASCIEDLLKFGQALLNNTLISKEMLDTMTTPVKLNNGRLLSYGLGTDVREDEYENRYFGHSGGGTGFVSHLFVYPEEKIVSAYLLNIRDRNLENPAQLFVWELLGNRPLGIPKKPVSDLLLEKTETDSIAAVIELYDIIKSDSTDVFIADVNELKNFGYDLLARKKYSEAILVFSKMTVDEPSLIDGYIGLGDTYLNDNNRGLALRNYRRALNIESSNSYCKKMIEKIEGRKIE